MSAFPFVRLGGYPNFTTADNGLVLSFSLPAAGGNPNDFTQTIGATLEVKDQNGNTLSRKLRYNSTTQAFEYSVVAGEFAAGRYWGEVTVTFTGPVGPIWSSEFIFDVTTPD